MLKVTNCDLNASTAKAIAQRVMKDKGLRVTERFVPADSHYTVNVNSNLRYRINLSDNTLRCYKDFKLGDGLCLTNFSEFKGSFDEVQERFYSLVKDLSKLLNK